MTELRGTLIRSERSHAQAQTWVQASHGREVLEQGRAIGVFLTGVEQRAFRMARVALRNDDDALDVVQDAMLKLARRYADRPGSEWPPLFFRILQNQIRDCQRRRKVRNRFLGWLPGFDREDGDPPDPMESVADGKPSTEQTLMTQEAIDRLEQALRELPQRQQEAFMLRNFQGLDVAETAQSMGCSEGSVKTHYSRAVHTLRARLGDAW